MQHLALYGTYIRLPSRPVPFVPSRPVLCCAVPAARAYLLTGDSQGVHAPGGGDAPRHQVGAVPADHLVHLVVQGVVHRVIVRRPGRLPQPTPQEGRGKQREMSHAAPPP